VEGEYICDECGCAAVDPVSVICPECGGELVCQMTPLEKQQAEVAFYRGKQPIEDPD
jgi:hypothetical protein